MCLRGIQVGDWIEKPRKSVENPKHGTDIRWRLVNCKLPRGDESFYFMTSNLTPPPSPPAPVTREGSTVGITTVENRAATPLGVRRMTVTPEQQQRIETNRKIALEKQRRHKRDRSEHAAEEYARNEVNNKMQATGDKSLKANQGNRNKAQESTTCSTHPRIKSLEPQAEQRSKPHSQTAAGQMKSNNRGSTKVVNSIRDSQQDDNDVKYKKTVKGSQTKGGRRRRTQQR